MEDVLSVYERPVDSLAPLICLDEFCKQLLSETRPHIAPQSGQLEKYDYEYVRNGSVSGFMMAAPFPLSQCSANRAGDGQSEYSQGSLTL